MSTAYGLRCKTCNKDSGYGTRHPTLLDNLVNLGPQIKALLDKDTDSLIELQASPGYGFEWWEEEGQSTSIYRWIARHVGHTLVIIDEYGREGELLDAATN